MKKTRRLVLSLLVAAALLLASCTSAAPTGSTAATTVRGQTTQSTSTTTTTTTAAAATTTTTTTTAAASGPELVRDPATGQMVKKPQYGGRISVAWASDPPHMDTWWGSIQTGIVSPVLEKMGIGNWALDRDIFDFKSSYFPMSALKGWLAESYEQPDPLTLIFHIRPGVHWHDKPPMNGRELVAQDIVINFHRITGSGSGFTEKSPYATNVADLPIESITATDRYTVVFKLTQVNFDALQMIYSESYEGAWIYPPEVIQQQGDMQDWQTAVGTGPFMLTDWVKSSSITYTKNPNYWGFDEKFPENRLPYADELKVLVIPELSTRLAALRSGKIVTLGGLTADQAESMRKTNPDLVQTTTMANTKCCASMDVRKPPFDDIRVRTAMQLAIDNETINDTYYGGYGDTTPFGVVGPAVLGFYTPFDDWPQDVKDNYAYDPVRAKQLLAEAGYPNGFQTGLEAAEGWGFMDLDLLQILASYWAEIGVDVEISLVEVATLIAHTRSNTFPGMSWGHRGTNYSPVFYLRIMAASGEEWNPAGSQDPVYDALVVAAETAANPEEMMEMARQADLYYSTQQWQVWTPRYPSFGFSQPWLGSYNGESTLGGGTGLLIQSRTWIDRDLKFEMTGQR